MKISRFSGNREFNKQVLSLAIPVLIQTGITNFVNILDNIMVGQLGTGPMSGVSVTNQLFSVFIAAVGGVLLGIGIFTAQYNGSGDMKGLQDTFRFKILASVGMTALFIAIFLLAGKPLISTYFSFQKTEETTLALESAWTYMSIMLIGFIPYAISMTYESSLRETGCTVPPMIASMIAVFSDLILNYLLIYGKCGLPALGVRGAAIATVIARFLELAVIVGWTHQTFHPLIRHLRLFASIPGALMRSMAKSGIPLLINELIYSVSNAIILQCLAMRGIEAVASVNITSNIILMNTIFLSAIGTALSIIIGNLLGAGKFEEARESNRKIITLSVLMCCVLALLLIPVSILFPRLFQTSDDIRSIAGQLIRVIAVFLPIRGFTFCAYHTLRSGGKTLLTLMFDGGYVTCICLPLILILSHFTSMPIVPLYALNLGAELSKCGIGFYFIKKGIWIRRVVIDKPEYYPAG